MSSKMVAEHHCFSLLDCSPSRLELRAINANGEELDHIVIDKKQGEISAPEPTQENP
jgi:hypothetical protein